MTPDMLGLITQFGAIAVLFLAIAAIMRGDFRTRQEITRAEQEIARLEQVIKDQNAAVVVATSACEREKDLLRKEVRDWQERAWDRLNEFAKPAVEALKDRRTV